MIIKRLSARSSYLHEVYFDVFGAEAHPKVKLIGYLNLVALKVALKAPDIKDTF